MMLLKDLGFISFFIFAFQPLQLSGHSKIISTTCFGQKDRPLLLCTASEDFIYIWNIDKILGVDNISKIYSFPSS